MGVISITWSSATVVTVTSELSPPHVQPSSLSRLFFFNFLSALFFSTFFQVELILVALSFCVFNYFPPHYPSLSVLYSCDLYPVLFRGFLCSFTFWLLTHFAPPSISISQLIHSFIFLSWPFCLFLVFFYHFLFAYWLIHLDYSLFY